LLWWRQVLLRRPLLREISAGKVTGSLRRKNRRRYSASLAMLKFFLTFILIATITFALVAQTPKPEATQYTCVMHPEVVQDHPGKCPKCGMELVPIKKSNAKHSTKLETVDSTAREPMHHHHMEERHATHEMKMQSSVNLADPMAREGSGTSRLQDSSPRYDHRFMLDPDMLMLHGAAFR